MDKKMKIKIILGSIREGRFGERPAKWVYEELAKREDMDVELLDLKDYSMPLFDSPMSPAMMGKKYQNEVVQKWSGKIEEADGYIIVSPEYNHGYSSVLKNALDWLAPEWYKKAVGFVGYGSAGGARAIEQLREVVIELKMVPINRSIHISWEFMMNAMNNKDIKNEELFEPLRKGRMDHLQIFVDDLLWMTSALKQAREK
jgi:NAD(P)H-dependent FMN reductase